MISIPNNLIHRNSMLLYSTSYSTNESSYSRPRRRNGNHFVCSQFYSEPMNTSTLKILPADFKSYIRIKSKNRRLLKAFWFQVLTIQFWNSWSQFHNFQTMSGSKDSQSSLKHNSSCLKPIAVEIKYIQFSICARFSQP